jgi:hypothetical protein
MTDLSVDLKAIEAVRFAYGCVYRALDTADTTSEYRCLLSSLADDMYAFISAIDLLLAEVAG